MYTTLIEPRELAHGGARDWALLDCRFDLARPQWGADAYAAGHIPRALYASLEQDLSGPVTSATGRHPLPPRERFAQTLGRWGIDPSIQVVAYDQNNGMFAARLWWMVRWLGHEAVAVLNGGFEAWQREGYSISTVAEAPAPRRFEPAPPLAPLISSAELLHSLHTKELERRGRLLIDARAADRFAGLNETLDPVAGHIPGAVNHPFSGNVDAQGRFLPVAALRSRWTAALGEVDASRVVSMCGSGVTACQNLLALELAGLPGAALYAGSWSEWIRDPARPTLPERSRDS